MLKDNDTKAASPALAEGGAGKRNGDGVALLEARKLTKHYPVKRSAMARGEWLRAVEGVDFAVHPNRVFSIVGESGCGKSTVARLLLRLTEPTSGEVLFRGHDVFALKGDGLKDFRRSVQIVFQDPFASLNPRRTVFQAIAEPMKVLGVSPDHEIRDRVVRILSKVGLKDVLGRYPHEFSGGQRQRVCIARALAVSPKVIVADEPLSALDVSVQAQILNLLISLKNEMAMSYVFISHDLRVVEYLSDEVAVMYLGSIVEQAAAEDLFREPLHPYTGMLLSSAPAISPGGRKKAVPGGEVPSPIDLPPGCPFHPRCPKRFSICNMESPTLRRIGNRSVACHIYGPPSEEDAAR